MATPRVLLEAAKRPPQQSVSQALATVPLSGIGPIWTRSERPLVPLTRLVLVSSSPGGPDRKLHSRPESK